MTSSSAVSIAGTLSAVAVVFRPLTVPPVAIPANSNRPSPTLVATAFHAAMSLSRMMLFTTYRTGAATFSLSPSQVLPIPATTSLKKSQSR